MPMNDARIAEIRQRLADANADQTQQTYTYFEPKTGRRISTSDSLAQTHLKRHAAEDLEYLLAKLDGK